MKLIKANLTAESEQQPCDPLHGQHQEAVEGERLAHLHTPRYIGHDSPGSWQNM